MMSRMESGLMIEAVFYIAILPVLAMLIAVYIIERCW
jgi:hypothetical protein